MLKSSHIPQIKLNELNVWATYGNMGVLNATTISWGINFEHIWINFNHNSLYVLGAWSTLLQDKINLPILKQDWHSVLHFLYVLLAPPPLPGVFIGLVQCVSSYTLSSPTFKGVTRGMKFNRLSSIVRPSKLVDSSNLTF